MRPWQEGRQAGDFGFVPTPAGAPSAPSTEFPDFDLMAPW